MDILAVLTVRLYTSLANGVLSVESNSVKSEYGAIIASDVALNTDKPEGGVQLPTKATLSRTANGVEKTARLTTIHLASQKLAILARLS